MALAGPTGNPVPEYRQFFETTVVSEAAAENLCAREETDGPIAPVFRFKTEQEAIEAANNTEFGLGREGSHRGMDDYVEIKFLCIGAS